MPGHDNSCAPHPRLAWLGYGGLVPFGALSLGILLRLEWHAVLRAPRLCYAGLSLLPA